MMYDDLDHLKFVSDFFCHTFVDKQRLGAWYSTRRTDAIRQESQLDIFCGQRPRHDVVPGNVTPLKYQSYQGTLVVAMMPSTRSLTYGVH